MQVEDPGHAEWAILARVLERLPKWGLQSVHPFVARPHYTVLAQSLPILGSLLAEPLTGLIDTAFVARLGAEALAALGVGTMVLSTVFWSFSFLGVATQTKVATLSGEEALAGSAGRSAARMCLVAVVVALLMGGAAAAIGLPLSGIIARGMGAEGEVQALTVDYLRWRFVGAPALLACFAAFGALRGAQDMRTPLFVAGGMNALNVVLDPLLIFGMAGLPAMGVAGAALASAISQWVGATWAIAAAFRRLGWPDAFDRRQIRSLLSAGVNLVFRAVSLNAFLILGTRKATVIGVGAGAVHQVIRSVWFFNALFLDSFAILGQSLIAYFLGNADRNTGRDVARVVCQWSFATGAALGLAMLAAESWMRRIYIPSSAAALFARPWRIAAACQPISGLTFGTDGVHFGTGDFRFLRNAVLAALLAGGAVIVWADSSAPWALDAVWWSFMVWTTLRAVVGMLRVWPGRATAPLGTGA